jgi:hypothetical protein
VIAVMATVLERPSSADTGAELIGVRAATRRLSGTNGVGRSAQGGPGEQVDFVGVGSAREQDELVAVGLGKARDLPLERLGVGQRTLGDTVRRLAQEAVEVEQIASRRGLRVLPQGEVGRGGQVGNAVAALVGPGLLNLLRGLAERVRAAAAGDPPTAVLGNPPDRGPATTPDQQR